MIRTYNIDADNNTLIHLVAPTSNINNKIIFAQDIGYFVARKNFFMRRRSLASYLVQYSMEGGGYLEYENRSYHIPANSVMIIDCMKPHYYCTDPTEDYWKTCWVHLYGSNSDYYYEQFLMANNGFPVANLSFQNHVSDAIHQVINLYQRFDCNLSTDIYASSLLTGILSECILTLDQTRMDSMPSQIRKAKEYIRRHYTEPLTLDKLSEELFISKFYLQRMFCQYMQMSPKEYLCQLRISQAKNLLRKTSLSVQEIAARVGYQNVSHFISLFRKYEHETPGAYRTHWNRTS